MGKKGRLVKHKKDIDSALATTSGYTGNRSSHEVSDTDIFDESTIPQNRRNNNSLCIVKIRSM